MIIHTEGAYRALFTAAETGGLSRSDRLAVALRVAAASSIATHPGETDPIVAHYRADLDPVLAERVLDGRISDPRLATVLRHADLLTVRPSAVTPAHHDQLAEAGLTVTDIVTLSQLVAFVSYQLRVVAGLAVLAETTRENRHG